ncbi:hypothetical protein [Methylobacterium frigidaeris]|nr:hypothetical protein [Methylobacterium frigidaeris]
MPWPYAFLLAMTIVCRFTVLAGGAYVVFGLDRSIWWFAVAIGATYLIPGEFNFSRKPQGKA